MINPHLYAILIPLSGCALWPGPCSSSIRYARNISPKPSGGQVDTAGYSPAMTAAAWQLRCCRALWGAYCDINSTIPTVRQRIHLQMRPFYHGIAGKISRESRIAPGRLCPAGPSPSVPASGCGLESATLLLLLSGLLRQPSPSSPAPIFAVAMPRLSGEILRKPAICATIALVLLGWHRATVHSIPIPLEAGNLAQSAWSPIRRAILVPRPISSRQTSSPPAAD